MENSFEDVFFGLSLTSFLSIIFFIAILTIVAQWKVYEKAGQPGWAALIPFVNIYYLLKIVGKSVWWLIFIIIFPPIGIILGIWMTNLLSKSFGKDVFFTIGLILFGFIFYPILGFGDAKYLGPAGK